MRCSSRYARIFYQANEGERKGAHQGIRAPARGQYHLDKCNARTNCVKKRSNRAEKVEPYTLKTRNVLLCFLITFFLSKWYCPQGVPLPRSQPRLEFDTGRGTPCGCPGAGVERFLQMILHLSFFPHRICTNILASLFQFLIIKDEMIMIVALPESTGAHQTGGLDLAQPGNGGQGFISPY